MDIDVLDKRVQALSALLPYVDALVALAAPAVMAADLAPVAEHLGVEPVAEAPAIEAAPEAPAAEEPKAE